MSVQASVYMSTSDIGCQTEDVVAVVASDGVESDGCEEIEEEMWERWFDSDIEIDDCTREDAVTIALNSVPVAAVPTVDAANAFDDEEMDDDTLLAVSILKSTRGVRCMYNYSMLLYVLLQYHLLCGCFLKSIVV
jgi:hypothetical protein